MHNSVVQQSPRWCHQQLAFLADLWAEPSLWPGVPDLLESHKAVAGCRLAGATLGIVRGW